MNITISPSVISGTIFSPASKSYTQRAIAIAMLAKGTTTLTNFGLCNDTLAAMDVAKKLGAKLTLTNRELKIEGGGITLENNSLNIGESGLSARLFTPFASLFSHAITVTGHGSILTRPIDMMIKPLSDLGVVISSNKGFLPIELCGPMRGGKVTIDGSLSSQFLTGLLISLPTCKDDSVINVVDLKSKPYIEMTLEVVSAFGVEIVNEKYKRFIMKGSQSYLPTIYNIEGDWSGASCLLVAGAIAGAITVENLDYNSRQADKEILIALRDAGAIIEVVGNSVKVSKSLLKAFTFDATDCPDLFPALVALAAACEGKTTIYGTSRLTHKESDRAKTLKDIYNIMGIKVDISCKNEMVIYGGAITGGVTVSSHNDHRIAMSAATSALRASSPIVITESECVNKSYNSFYDDLKSLIF